MFKKIFFRTALVLNLFGGHVGLHAITAERIVTSVLDKIAPFPWEGQYKFTNYRTDGTHQEYVLKILGKDRTTVLVTFLSPPRDKGRQVLNRDGQIWSFLPDSRKVVRLADRDSIANGDFNNADVLKLDWLRSYSPKIVKESAKQYVVDLKAIPGKEAAYFLIRLWVFKDSLQPIQQFFYDSSGHHLKTLKYRKIKNFHGIVRPSLMIMENMITGQRTVLQILDFRRAASAPSYLFRPANLGK